MTDINKLMELAKDGFCEGYCIGNSDGYMCADSVYTGTIDKLNFIILALSELGSLTALQMAKEIKETIEGKPIVNDELEEMGMEECACGFGGEPEWEESEAKEQIEKFISEFKS